MNLQTMEAEVSRLVQRKVLDSSTSPVTYDDTFWSQAEVWDALNKACEKFNADTYYLRAVLSQAVPIAAATVAVPTDCIHVRALHWNGKSLWPITNAQLMGFDNAATDTGCPQWYRQDRDGSESVRLYPIPDAPGTLEWEYVPTPTTLAALSDSPEFPRRYHQALCYYAAHLLILKHMDELEMSKSDRMLARYQEETAYALSESSRHFNGNYTIPLRFW